MIDVLTHPIFVFVSTVNMKISGSEIGKIVSRKSFNTWNELLLISDGHFRIIILCWKIYYTKNVLFEFEARKNEAKIYYYWSNWKFMRNINILGRISVYDAVYNRKFPKIIMKYMSIFFSSLHSTISKEEKKNLLENLYVIMKMVSPCLSNE